MQRKCRNTLRSQLTPTADWLPRKFGWFLLFTVCLIAQQCVYVEGDICNCQGSEEVDPDDIRTEP